MKRILANVLIIVSLSVVLLAQGNDVFKQTLPSTAILKPTLKVKTVRDQNYWKQPTLKNFWSWMPKVEFALTGPVADASYLTYEFFTADGKLWFSQDSKPFSIAEGQFQVFES